MLALRSDNIRGLHQIGSATVAHAWHKDGCQQTREESLECEEEEANGRFMAGRGATTLRDAKTAAECSERVEIVVKMSPSRGHRKTVPSVLLDVATGIEARGTAASNK